MKRSRINAVIVLLIGIAVLTFGVAAATSDRPTAVDHHHHEPPPLTYEEVVRIYNPTNSPHTTIVDNGDGTFTIDFTLPGE